MSVQRIHRRGAIAAAASVLLAGCASTSIQTDARSFFEEHAITAAKVATSTEAVKEEVSRLGRSPRPSQLQRLAQAAAKAKRAGVLASEWNIAKSGEGGEEALEEEDLPRAETEATKGADELASAMSDAQAYARAPSAASLARFRSELAHGSELWDESISQVWHLAHESSPPTI